jgi:hypothetical protein
MTVQEAKEILEYYYNQEWFLEKDPPAKIAFKLSIESMKEVEQYRAIAEVIEDFDNVERETLALALEELKQYRAFGTLEELKSRLG